MNVQTAKKNYKTLSNRNVRKKPLEKICVKGEAK